MDGLTVTCRTCGVKTSFEDAESHICQSRPFQQVSQPQRQQQRPYGDGYDGPGPRRPEDQARRFQPNRSDAGFNQREPARRMPEPGRLNRDDLTLPQFDLGSIGAPHSFNGPYGSIPSSRGPPSVGTPPPQQRPGPPLMQRNPYNRPDSRNGPRNDPFPPRQQQAGAPPPRPRYMDDFDYSRPPSRHGEPPPRILAAPDPRYRQAPPRLHGNEPMNRPPTRQQDDPRQRPSPPNGSFEERRRSPERRMPEPLRPESRSRQENMYTQRNEESIDRGMVRGFNNPSEPVRPPPSRGNPYMTPSASLNSLEERSLGPPVEEKELWRQIRSQAQQQKKSRSISSTGSSDSNYTSRSARSETGRSENTMPSSVASPITPTKQTDYPPLPPKDVSPKYRDESPTELEHNRNDSKTTVSVCRACDEPIRGRSLASKDGKLSGRYHKRCFCCTTCQAPFETASFYVFKDRPYCKRHYHELNNSTCAECGDGVEGQCLQLEDSTIRHPSCFTCTTCHCSLDEDYYESKGKPYCERHARMTGRNDGKMERRKTRLLVM